MFMSTHNHMDNCARDCDFYGEAYYVLYWNNTCVCCTGKIDFASRSLEQLVDKGVLLEERGTKMYQKITEEGFEIDEYIAYVRDMYNSDAGLVTRAEMEQYITEKFADIELRPEYEVYFPVRLRATSPGVDGYAKYQNTFNSTGPYFELPKIPYVYLKKQLWREEFHTKISGICYKHKIY